MAAVCDAAAKWSEALRAYDDAEEDDVFDATEAESEATADLLKAVDLLRRAKGGVA